MNLWLKTPPKRLLRAITFPACAFLLALIVALFAKSEDVEKSRWYFLDDMFSDVFR